MIFLLGESAKKLIQRFHLGEVSTKCKLPFAAITVESIEDFTQVVISPNYEYPGLERAMQGLLQDCDSPTAVRWRSDCLLARDVEDKLENFARINKLLLERKGDRIVLSPIHSVKLFNEAEVKK